MGFSPLLTQPAVLLLLYEHPAARICPGVTSQCCTVAVLAANRQPGCCKPQAAAADPSKSCPVVRILGYLEAPASDEAFAVNEDPADTLWLVYKFEGMRPLSLMLQQIDVPEEPSGLAAMFLKK